MLVDTLEMAQLLHPVALWHVHNLHAAAVLAGGRAATISIRARKANRVLEGDEFEAHALVSTAWSRHFDRDLRTRHRPPKH